MTKLQNIAKKLAEDKDNKEYNFISWENYGKKRIYINKKSSGKKMCYYEFDEEYNIINSNKVDDTDKKIIDNYLNATAEEKKTKLKENTNNNHSINPWEKDDKLNENFAFVDMVMNQN